MLFNYFSTTASLGRHFYFIVMFIRRSLVVGGFVRQKARRTIENPATSVFQQCGIINR